MAKIKITTLTDKSTDDELLSKLKKIGVKVKDKRQETVHSEEPKDTTPPSNENLTETRVGTTIIRRRLQPTPKEVKKEELEATKETIALQEKKEAPREKREEPFAEKIKKKPRYGKKKVAEEFPEPVRDETIGEKETLPQPSPEARPPEALKIEKEKKEPLKDEIEHIDEEKEKEITKALEEAYKKDLEKDFTLVEIGEEDKKKKKTEKLLKKIEEQEAEETKLKKKGLFKRKVVIKEEDLYAFRRPRLRTVPIRKERKEKIEKKAEERAVELKPVKRTIKIGDEIYIGKLANMMGIKAPEVISKLLALGIIANINQSIDYDTAYLVAAEFGFEVEKIVSIEEEFIEQQGKGEKEENLLPRPPVVTIMGHVDHGKTLLLDTIRQTNVAEQETGGITQHIGAYKVNVNSKEIVFVDTPGHEAFTAMRARGALVTDIVVLVVAADDGVMPQTIEAIDHARAARVPIIVAINKIDKQNANPDKVMKELSELGLVPEEWGGTTLFAKISAKKKVGIKELLELIILQSEVLELKANPEKLAKGIIIESRLDKGQGPVGTVIIQEGTLKIQDPFVAGSTFGRVRAMMDDKGNRIQVAPPSTPVLVVGFQDVPHGGDKFIVTTEEWYAKALSKYRQDKEKERDIGKSSRTTLEDLYAKMGESDKTVLNLILKGDVRGTIDAITEALGKLSTNSIQIQIIHSGVGAITETDVNLAVASGAIIVGFNTKPVGKAQSLAEHENVEIRTYSIIYDLIDDVKKAMEGMLEPKIIEVPIGKAEVRKVFTFSKIGSIAGSAVIEGKVLRNATVKVLRDGTILYAGKISSLKRFKDDVKEVQAGYECGVSIENFNDIREGDILEFFIEEKERPTLEG